MRQIDALGRIARRGLVAGAVLWAALALGGPAAAAADQDRVTPLEESPSRFSDEPMPITMDEVPGRPRPLIEFGDPFLKTGEISDGIAMPWGPVWRPQLMLFGTVRSALQHFDPGPGMRDEWVNRADIFVNLQLSPTERFIIGSRMLDKNGRFTGYRFHPDGEDFIEEINANISTAYFEGDFGQLFPRLDPQDNLRLDYGFTVGRQPLLIQDGLLINDNSIDALGVVRNNLFLPGTTQGRLTGLYSWSEIHRGNNRLDQSAEMYALFFEADTKWLSTVNAEFIYVDSDDLADGFWYGLSSIQRIGPVGTTFAVVHSDVSGRDRPEAADGTLLFAQANYKPHGTDNFIYTSGFWGIDRFRSASRAPGTGTALGRAGILFAGVGIGGFGAALSNDGAEAVGGVLGYQMFFSKFRRQLTLEVGAREETEGPESGAWAIGAQYLQAIGRRLQFRANGFLGERQTTGSMDGLSIELLLRL